MPFNEPTLHLDINHQFDLMDVCRRVIARHNIIIILVTHDLQIDARYCDRVIVMEHGRIVSMGETDEVVNERMIEDVFHMVARVNHDPEIDGLSVLLIRKTDDTHKDR